MSVPLSSSEMSRFDMAFQVMQHFFVQLQPLMVLLPPKVRVTRGGGIPVMAYHSGACRWLSRPVVEWALQH